MKITILSAAAAATIAVIAIAGCDSGGGGVNDNVNNFLRQFDAPEYVVTVSSDGTDGYGGGSYVAGATVGIYAGEPIAGRVFWHWRADEGNVVFADVNSAATTFIMPESRVKITAVFGERPKHAVEISSEGLGASGGGEYSTGVTVGIYAGEPTGGWVFWRWRVDEGDVEFADENGAATTFVMPDSRVKLTAVFGERPRHAVEISSDGLGASGGGSYAEGSTVSISAGTPQGGWRFMFWTTESAGVTFADANSETTTFVMPENDVALLAVFGERPKHRVNISSEGFGAFGGGSYAEGSTVSISAGTPQDGWVFGYWATNNAAVNFADGNSETTTFVMPESDVALQAVFFEKQ
jgi:hypothetical protein